MGEKKPHSDPKKKAKKKTSQQLLTHKWPSNDVENTNDPNQRGD